MPCNSPRNTILPKLRSHVAWSSFLLIITWRNAGYIPPGNRSSTEVPKSGPMFIRHLRYVIQTQCNKMNGKVTCSSWFISEDRWPAFVCNVSKGECTLAGAKYTGLRNRGEVFGKMVGRQSWITLLERSKPYSVIIMGLASKTNNRHLPFDC